MSRLGGVATQTGVKYEIQFGVYKIPDLLEGRITAMRYQPPSTALSPSQLPTRIFVDDYTMQDSEGNKLFYQVKHNSNDASWTVNRLIDEGVVKQFLEQSPTETECALFFVSNIAAPNLQNLANHARQSVSLEEFEATLNAQMQMDCRQIASKLQIDLRTLWPLVKKVQTILLPEEQIVTRVTDYAGIRYSDPKKFALVLKDFIENHPGSLLLKEMVTDELDRCGLFRLPTLPLLDVPTVLRQASGSVRLCKSDILGVHIPRKETERLQQWVSSTAEKPHVAFLVDGAGTGKSVILHDLLERLESQNMPVLAIKADSLVGVTNAETLIAKLGLPAPPESLLAAAAQISVAVLVIDQLDALSSTFSRDQQCLYTIRDLIGITATGSKSLTKYPKYCLRFSKKPKGNWMRCQSRVSGSSQMTASVWRC